MSPFNGDKPKDSGTEKMVFFQLKNGLNSPKQVLKLVAVIICLCVASYQLSECFRKLLHPPVSTHYSFDLNDTLNYPAVTICRTPAYKTSVYEKYGINSDGPMKSASWSNFHFNNFSMQEFFEEATYSFQEVVPFFGFDTLDTNTDVTSFYLLHYGKCFTITPKNETTDWYSDGYFLYLSHSENVKTVNDKGVSLSGFHIYIHDRRDVFTGNKDKVDSFLNYLYGEIYEEIKLNLEVQVYQQLSTKDTYCNDSYAYSLSRCQLFCLQKMITSKVGCSTPWLPNSNLDHCKNYNDTRLLMQAYDTYQREDYLKQCACPQACHIKIYNHYIHSIKDNTRSTCEISIKFSSNLITSLREVIGYDWNLFLSDLGGSLGFLLGISVLGLVNLCEDMINILLCKQKESGNDEMNEDDNHKKMERIENISKKEHREMQMHFKQKMMLEEVIAKNNTSLEYSDNSKQNNNHAKYILNKY